MLTNKQQRFTEEYMIDCNASAAALRAGYSRKAYGRELMQKEHIQQEISAKMNELQVRTKLEVDDVIEGLLYEAHNAESDGARVRAWYILGKHLNMFTESVRHYADNVQVIVEYPPAEDLPLPDGQKE